MIKNCVSGGDRKWWGNAEQPSAADGDAPGSLSLGAASSVARRSPPPAPRPLRQQGRQEKQGSCADSDTRAFSASELPNPPSEFRFQDWCFVNRPPKPHLHGTAGLHVSYLCSLWAQTAAAQLQTSLPAPSLCDCSCNIARNLFLSECNTQMTIVMNTGTNTR